MVRSGQRWIVRWGDANVRMEVVGASRDWIILAEDGWTPGSQRTRKVLATSPEDLIRRGALIDEDDPTEPDL